MLPKVFTGRPPFSEFTTPVTISKIMGGERPARPQGAQERGLADPVWDMTVHCWHQDPVQRPKMTEVVGFLRELLVLSLSIDTDLGGFFKVYKTRGNDDRREKAQEFADRLDEVRHTEGHDIRSFHYASRFLIMQIFKRKTARNI